MTFNYIITCHNSEELIADVLEGVFKSIRFGPIGNGAQTYVVLDGCTDKTEAIIDEWIRIGYPIKKVHTPDVHELLSVNAGLRAANQMDEGYNIILQDDVILKEPDLESLIVDLYEQIPMLGYVSLRLAVDFAHDDGSRAFIAEMHNLESVYGAGCTTEKLMPYEFAYRAMPIKSPVVLPCSVVREVGYFNEDLAPYAYDDAEYALRCAQSGFVQGVFSIPFMSDYRWGGTRRGGHPDILPVAARNCTYIRELWQEYINSLAEVHGHNRARRDNRVQIRPCSDETRDKALAQWAEAQKLLAAVEHGEIKLGADSRERAFEMLHKNQGF